MTTLAHNLLDRRIAYYVAELEQVNEERAKLAVELDSAKS